LRALFHNVGIVTTANQALQEIPAAILRRPRRSIRDKSGFASRIMSNMSRLSGTQAVIYHCWA
jgi:hypothetical protein